MPDASDGGRRRPRLGGSRRAQSEVIGYVIVFSTVIVALGVAAVFGFTALEEVRQATIANGGERVIDSVGGDVDALYQGTALSRSTEVTLDSGGVETGQPVSMRVVVESGGRLPAGATPPFEVVDRSFRPVVYRGGDTAIAYDNTLVVREDEGGAVALSDHMFRLSGGRSVVPVVATTPPEPQSSSGGTVRIQTGLAGSESHVVTRAASAPPSGMVVRLELAGQTPERADVWLRQLNAELDDPSVTSPRDPNPPCFHPSGDQTRVHCRYNTDRILVSVVEIRYTLG